MTTVGIVTGAGRGMGLACARRLAVMVDALLLVDLDEAAVTAAAADLASPCTGDGADRASAGHHAVVEPFRLDVTDRDGLARLASRVRELGPLRAVAHAAGISPTMADWRRILTVDLTGTALLAGALRPLATAGTAMVCFASMAPLLGGAEPDPAVAAILDDPLDERFPDRLRDALGPSVEDSGQAYAWAKRGVHRFVRREALRLGPAGARICSVSPGIIDTPQGQQEARTHPVMAELVRQTPLGRAGRPDEVAAVVAFLLSADAGFLTGIDVLVDGGVCAAVADRRP
jgi:NAD(P)-dependent dehydrogenase (short-subunit alcohol dehydrogenase family)